VSTVKLKGWKPGLKKVSLSKVIRKHTGYSLVEGKRCTDYLLAHKEVVISNLSKPAAKELLKEVIEIGCVATIED